jgi:predicted GTPase
VVVHWPIPFLTAGLYLVDSPGIGESDFMNERVIAYMREAIAFIYIINTTAAGGVTAGRLDKLLTINTQQTDLASLKTFNPRAALFVFNKWDKIKDDVKTTIKDVVLEKLRSKWPKAKFDEEDQVHYLSVTVAKNCLELKIVLPPEYRSFQNKFYSFLRDGLENMVQQHIQWLDNLISQAQTCVMTPINQAKRKDKVHQDKMRKISEYLSKLKTETKFII